MADEPQHFDEILCIEPLEGDAFSTCLRGFEGRSFGGQTLGCAARAAARTCDGRALHSLHACFLRPVPADVPIELVVERVRDGRRFAHRRVRVRHQDRVCCELVTSFTTPGEGAEYQDAAVEPGTPAPETLPSEEEVARAEGWEFWGAGPFEMRWVGTPWRPESTSEHSRYHTWVKTRIPLASDDRELRAGALAFLSDFHSHWPVVRKLGLDLEPVGFVSLDQVVWVHRDLPWDGWWLIRSESDVAHAGRALCRRSLYTRDGRLVASMAQEALIPDAPSRAGA